MPKDKPCRRCSPAPNHVLIAATNVRGDDFENDAVFAFAITERQLREVDALKLDRSFVGRDFDEALLSALPEEVDPCGERGEFHSFVYRGPMLDTILPVSVGGTVVRDQFIFADLIAS